MSFNQLSINLEHYSSTKLHIGDRNNDYAWLLEISINLNLLFIQHIILDSHPFARGKAFRCSKIDLENHDEILKLENLVWCIGKTKANQHHRNIGKCCVRYLSELGLTNHEVVYRKLYKYAKEIVMTYYPR